jgi:group I intron endonuclease
MFKTIQVLNQDVEVRIGPSDFHYKTLSKFKRCGVYIVWNKISKKGYVGSSYNIGGRFKSHFDALQGGLHNRKLQRSWDKHGGSAFEYHILELCCEEEQFDIEDQWIQRLDSYENGYNCTPSAHIVSVWTEERLQWLTERSKKWHAEGILGTPEMREATSIRMLKMHSEFPELIYNEKWKENTNKALLERNSSQKQKDAVVASWTEERKEKQRKLTAEHNRTPEMIQVVTARIQAINADPEFKKKTIERNKSEEMRKLNSVRLKKQWEDPNFREKMKGLNRSTRNKGVRNVMLTAFGETKQLCDWADLSGISGTTISRRLKRGLTLEQAVIQPDKFGNYYKYNLEKEP